MKIFDTSKIKPAPLEERKNRARIQDIAITPQTPIPQSPNLEAITRLAQRIITARKNHRPVILAFGAHLIKNGLSPMLIELIKNDYVSHLATNGAGTIHDWEFAFQGGTDEDVRENIKKGRFGTWDETGKYLNLAIINGAKNNKGYGESIGEMINKDKVENIDVNHPFKEYSIQNAAYEKNIPFTVHPGIGYDIIYTHPLFDGAAVGKTSRTDFLRYVQSVSELEGGVYISIGSAIMSPMIFEKALSMARNVAEQKDRQITDFTIAVNDIADEKTWEFGTGQEPSKDDPAYYSRLCKSFDRMGAKNMDYIKEDNRSFLQNLSHELTKTSQPQ